MDITLAQSTATGVGPPAARLTEQAQARDLLVGITPFLVGVVVVMLLIGAVALGKRLLRRESPRPRPEEQPHLPPGGPVGEVFEHRVDAEMPRDGHRRMPYEIHDYGTETAPEDLGRSERGGPPVSGRPEVPARTHDDSRTRRRVGEAPEDASPGDVPGVRRTGDSAGPPSEGDTGTDDVPHVRRTDDKPGPALPDSNARPNG